MSSATCIVVGGYYNRNEKLSYYRMDFDPDNKENAFGQILRNHKYIFNVKKVSAPGWDNPDDAANNQSAHIVAEVRQWMIIRSICLLTESIISEFPPVKSY